MNFQTVNVGTACASIEDGNTLELSCQGESSISEIKFASYGDPNGTCGSFNKGTCESQNALDVLQKVNNKFISPLIFSLFFFFIYLTLLFYFILRTWHIGVQLGLAPTQDQLIVPNQNLHKKKKKMVIYALVFDKSMQSMSMTSNSHLYH